MIHLIEAVYVWITVLGFRRDGIRVSGVVAMMWVMQTLLLGYPSIMTMRHEVVGLKKKMSEDGR